jgi:hypothetical protein
LVLGGPRIYVSEIHRVFGGWPAQHIHDLTVSQLYAFTGVWNAARSTFPHAPFKPGYEPPAAVDGVSASFHNTGMDPKNNDGKLYYDEDGFFGDLGPGATIRVNTFSGHKWNLKSPSGAILASWVINDREKDQDFVL